MAGGWFEEILYMEFALMQQPSHMYVYMIGNSRIHLFVDSM